MVISGGVVAICAVKAAGKPRGRILPEDARPVPSLKRWPDTPVAAGRAGAALRIVPATTLTQAGDHLRFNRDDVRCWAGLSFATPAFTTGATLAVDALNQQVFASRQAAMLWLAGTSPPPSLTQPLIPPLTL